MKAFDHSRVSGVATEVYPGCEAEFLAAVRELHDLIRLKGYGSDQLLQDASNPRLYFDIRTWTSIEAANRCHADPDVLAVWAKLDRLMKLTHLFGVASPVAYEAGAGDRGETAVERRSETNRRSRSDRRVQKRSRAEGERRSGADRRSGMDRRAGGRVVAGAAASDLVNAARGARERAHAPFSRFKVGAALETAEGHIITGCNVENATYGLTLCAERVALFKAVSEGHRAFTRVAVVADTTDPTPPCGPCRQILWEFGGDLEVILADLKHETGRYRLSELLPLPFDQRLLHRSQTIAT